MSEWAFLFLLVWFLGTCAGTAVAIVIVRGGSMRPTPGPADPTARHDQESAA